MGIGSRGSKPAQDRSPIDHAEAGIPPDSSERYGGAGLSPGDLEEAAALFRLAGDPDRLNLILTLAEGDRDVGELCAHLGQDQPAVSHQLAMLRHGGLIQHHRQGKNHRYSLTDQGRQVAGRLREFLPPESSRGDLGSGSPSIDPALLADVRGFVDDAEGWFHSPNPEFEGRTPVELLGTAEEPRLRNRIEAAKLGLFS